MQAHRLYSGVVDGLFIRDMTLFSGGDRQILASEVRTGTTQCLYDTTLIPDYGLLCHGGLLSHYDLDQGQGR